MCKRDGGAGAGLAAVERGDQPAIGVKDARGLIFGRVIGQGSDACAEGFYGIAIPKHDATGGDDCSDERNDQRSRLVYPRPSAAFGCAAIRSTP